MECTNILMDINGCSENSKTNHLKGKNLYYLSHVSNLTNIYYCNKDFKTH